MTGVRFAEPSFEPVRSVFEATLRDSSEGGGAFAVVLDGRLVVDLWGGIADPVTRQAWDNDTVAPVLSCTKALSAACVLLLADRGRITLDERVSRYWPEFGEAGKADVRIDEVLTHRSGVPGIIDHLEIEDLLDPAAMARRVAAQEPIVPVGAISYHLATFGWICAELVRRVDGRSLGRFLVEEIARPLGIAAWIGLPLDEDVPLAAIGMAPGWGKVTPLLVGAAADPSVAAVWANPPLLRADSMVFGRRHVLASEIGGLGGVSSARSLALVIDAVAAGRPPFTRAWSVDILDGRAAGKDVLLGDDRAYGLGFELQTDAMVLGPPGDAFGQTGAGGAIVGAWPSRRLAFAYVTNDLRDTVRDDRRDLLLRCVNSILDGGPTAGLGSAVPYV